MKYDDLGNRMKVYEKSSSNKFLPLLPVCARLDGKCFSTFTKGLERPYDQRMSHLMQEVTKYLIDETGALVGYTQSDEITLMWYSNNTKKQTFFGGKDQKIVSILAAMASVKFNQLLQIYLPSKSDKLPIFDCRAWTVPNKDEAANVFLWREKDATKNSISMAASHYYSHKELHKRSGSMKQDMLIDKGINWNDYPAFFKRGTFIRRHTKLVPFTTEEISRLPDNHAYRANPNLMMSRKVIEVVPMPSFSAVSNRVGVLFDGESPKQHINTDSR